MSATYSLDGSNIFDPALIAWEPKTMLAQNHNQAPMYAATRRFTLTFPAMTPANHALWAAADNGATHTIDVHDPTLVTITHYTGVYLRMTGGGRRAGAYVENATVEVWNVTA